MNENAPRFPLSCVRIGDRFKLEGRELFKYAEGRARAPIPGAPVEEIDPAALVEVLHYVPTLGARVETPTHGPGTVEGFEVLYLTHSALSPAPDPSARVCVRLDNPERWILSAPGVLPYYMPGELKPE